MDKVMELLEQLASSLGVAVEYLWTTLVKQQYVEGVTNLAMAVVGVVAIIVLSCLVTRATKGLDNKYKELKSSRLNDGTGFNGSYRVASMAEDSFNTLRFLVPIAICIVIFVIFACTIDNIKFGIQQLLNPDYFALKEVLDTISG